MRKGSVKKTIMQKELHEEQQQRSNARKAMRKEWHKEQHEEQQCEEQRKRNVEKINLDSKNQYLADATQNQNSKQTNTK